MPGFDTGFASKFLNLCNLRNLRIFTSSGSALKGRLSATIDLGARVTTRYSDGELG